MTLLIGGPFNGEDREIPESWGSSILLPLPEDYRIGGSGPLFRTVHYRRRHLTWFGRALTVFVAEGLADAELDVAMVSLTLNETGLKLWRDGTPIPDPEP